MRSNKGISLLRVALVVVAGSAFAQAPAPPPSDSMSASDSGISLGLRAGYGVPLGTATGVTGAPNISSSIAGTIPLWADVGYRFASNWYIGGFFQYGIGILASNVCATGTSCTNYDMRFGLNAHYHFMPGQMLDPWVGIGAGYEILSTTVTPTGGTGVTSNVRGFEFGNAQVGLDWMATPSLGVGPFVAFTVAQYTDASVGSVSASITNKSIHEWLLFGLRGVFNIGI
jgi:opacity protein-like surface antigen